MTFYLNDLREELKSQLALAQFDLEDAQEAYEYWSAQSEDEPISYEDDIGLVHSTAGKQARQYFENALPAAITKVEIYKFLLSKFAAESGNEGGAPGAVSSGAGFYVPLTGAHAYRQTV